MKNIMFAFRLLFIAVALAGCNIPAASTVTVLPPTAPVVATSTVAAPATQPAPTQTMVPSAVPTATVPVMPTTAGVTPVTPGQGAPEAIAILEPGPGSRVVSPVRIRGVADPTFEQSLAITILLADGTALITTSTQIGADVGQRGPFLAEVPFSVSQDQPGFIQVYAISAKDGGITHLSSTFVTLAAGGTADIRPASEGPEQIQILSPANGDTISGGTLHMEGYGLASFEQTLVIELLNEDGAVIASTPVTIAAPDLGQPGPFSADLSYSLPAASMSARLQVRDISPAHGDNTHVSSVEIKLQP
jgi:hypothetical protein